MRLDNAALDARPFSLTGLNTPKPAYNDLTGVATLGGPLRIPHISPTVLISLSATSGHETATPQRNPPRSQIWRNEMEIFRKR